MKPGDVLGSYRIVSRLGAGGMGEVYRATDTRLDRTVALKVLSDAHGADAERLQRFEREARTLAAVNHPNIVTIYAVETAGDVRVLAMELVEGETLTEVIRGRSGLPLQRFLDIAIPMTDAVAAAHARGIVHRDLKPGNVMLAGDGRVKVLDFGLAKVVTTDDAPTVTHLTTQGTVVGTTAYMSPEQLRGGAIDARSDIFALGVVLYEMATGDRPFHGQSTSDLISAILRDQPRPMTALRPDLPVDLWRVIARCLQKGPADRYQTSSDVCRALRDVDTAAPTRAVAVPIVDREPASAAQDSATHDEGFWVAVHPFTFRGADPELEALAGGMSEDIVTGLSRFSYLRVIARSATAHHPARYVLEGSIRQAGSTLRLAAQLVDAGTGVHLWAETYDRPFRPDDVLALVDDVAPRIVSTIADMNGILPRTMSESLRSRDLDSLSPYEAVLRSFGYLERIEADEHASVRACLERTITEASGSADGWAMRSFFYAEEFKHGFNVRPGSLDRALMAARRAVAAAPSNHLAYHVLAQALFFRRELDAFRTAAEKAVALNPMDGCTTAFMGILMAYAGDWEHGCALAERAMQLNPNHPGWYRFAAFLNAYRQDDYRAAVDVALRFNMPSYFYTHMALAAAYGQLGDQRAAARAVEELLALKPDFASVGRDEYAKWTGRGELLDKVFDGLRKAGLNG